MANTDKLVYLPQLQRYDEKLKRWVNDEFLAKADTVVTDVRINGTTITVGGVADIPISDGTTIGVIMTDNSSGGFSTGLISVNNRLYLKNAALNEITERSFRIPILANNMDYAVKAAMCDGKGAAWTAEEQAAAKERMGIGDYSLPPATNTVLGGVKIGNGLSVTDDGVLSAEDDIVFTWDFDTSAFSCNKTFAEVKKIITTGVRRTATANGISEGFSVTLLVGVANDNAVVFFGTAPTDTFGAGMLGSRVDGTITYLFQDGLGIMYTSDGHIQKIDLSNLNTNMSFDFKNTTFQYDQYSSFDLKDGGVTSAKIANSAITADKIADGAITANKIADGVIDAASSRTIQATGTAPLNLSVESLPDGGSKITGSLNIGAGLRVEAQYGLLMPSVDNETIGIGPQGLCTLEQDMKILTVETPIQIREGSVSAVAQNSIVFVMFNEVIIPTTSKTLVGQITDVNFRPFTKIVGTVLANGDNRIDSAFATVEDDGRIFIEPLYSSFLSWSGTLIYPKI